MISIRTPSSWFDAVADGLLLIEQGRVQEINRAAATFLEVEPAEAVGLPLIAVVRDHRLERVVVEGGEVELETRGRIIRAYSIPDGLVLRDVTEARRAKENARELLAVLSHELRTPVTTIHSTLEALHYDLPEAQRERFLLRAQGEVERLVRLLDDLTVDVKPPRLRRIALGDVLERAVALLHDTFEEHGIRLTLEVAELTVWADHDKLLQVLINLLENAAVHGPDDNEIVLKAFVNPERQGEAQVLVQDQGEPLEPTAMERLFEPHARGVASKTQGTGLGLYIVRSIAERWGGYAWGKPLEHGNEFGFSVLLR